MSAKEVTNKAPNGVNDSASDSDDNNVHEFDDQPLALSASEMRCLKALKKHHMVYANQNAAFHKELHALECKYNRLYADYYTKRTAIITDEYKPTDSEAEFELNDDIGVKLDTEKKFEKGIEDFWLTVIENSSFASNFVYPHDRPILKHLKNVELVMNEDPMFYELRFHFEPNDYFTNEVLVKKYLLKIAVPETRPSDFDGIEYKRSEGTVINWKPRKDVTKKVETKKQKHKSTGAVRTIKKTTEQKSFFNFFTPVEGSNVEDIAELGELDEELESQLTNDFELGNYFKERLVPYAIDYFTNEYSDAESDEDDEDDDDEDEYDDEEGDEDDDDGDEDDDDDGGNDGRQRPDANGKKTAGSKRKTVAAHGREPECKQQ